MYVFNIFYLELLCTMHTCSFIQGHIISGLKSRIKDFRRTPKHMIRVPPKPRAGKENIPSTPDSSDEEDDVSFQRHVKILQQERRKTKPNLQVIRELMAVTYCRRHKEIKDHPEPVQTILLKYPFLHEYDEVSS